MIIDRDERTHGIAVQLSMLWNSTSRPALICSSFEQLSVLYVSTIPGRECISPCECHKQLNMGSPNVGLRARLAMPVLNDIEVMSRIAVPVVSDPVPAVVGTVIW
jgi:hypothetical protein